MISSMKLGCAMNKTRIVRADCPHGPLSKLVDPAKAGVGSYLATLQPVAVCKSFLQWSQSTQLVKYGRNGSRQHMASGHRDTQGDTQADEERCTRSLVTQL